MILVNTNTTSDRCVTQYISICIIDADSNINVMLRMKTLEQNFYFIVNTYNMDSINWEIFESFIGEKIPACIKTVLNLCGYTSFLSLKEIKPHNINEIETFVTEHFSSNISQLQCCHSQYYSSQISRGQFKFLPGHETLLIVLPKYVSEFQNAYMKKIIDLDGRYSFILNELVKTAEENKYKVANQTSYPDTIRFFAAYVFLLCGRACYKMLQSNLPIPSVPTIRKSNVCFDLT